MSNENEISLIAPKPAQESVVIPLEYKITNDVIGIYADNLIVQHTDNEFILSFFQIHYPPQPPENGVLKSLQANLIARVILSPKHMEGLVEVVAANFIKYKVALEKNKVGDEL
jgi:hypothetical protein